MPLLMTGYAGNLAGDAELTNTGAQEFVAVFNEILQNRRAANTP